ncbi:MAG: dihydropteroate synthase, partial [Silvanigrellaceae bacterium]|nr:dihydropteroate synthase [Silvanigrellaceae bacterium]
RENTIWMGILNLTPDSFSDGGLYYQSPKKALARALELVRYGAKIIDVGGVSTRPTNVYGGSNHTITPQQELNRIFDSLVLLRKELPSSVLISIDTYSPYVAAQLASQGLIDVINDVYAGGVVEEVKPNSYATTFHIASEYKCGLIAMHMQGSPQTMQINPVYENCIEDVFNFFVKKISFAQEMKISSLILDPGIGFGKTFEHNLLLLSKQGIQKFKELNLPLVYGLSRKKFIKTLYQTKQCNDFLCIDFYAKDLEEECFNQGVKIIRTHRLPQEL